jgi:hypothetical protein
MAVMEIDMSRGELVWVRSKGSRDLDEPALTPKIRVQAASPERDTSDTSGQQRESREQRWTLALDGGSRARGWY